MSEKALPEPLLVKCPKDKIIKKVDNCLKCTYFEGIRNNCVYCSFVSKEIRELYQLELKIQDKSRNNP
ncbi:hypothetical protein DRN86_01835 [Candidatus Geothermarchaeota archaeon]|nr:MAG: hypothetical protein DRN86_01835 [Candidatus Geothermarchaeota archaeon]